MQHRTLLFDLDGTLVDAFTTLYRSYVHTLPRFGYPAPSYEAVRRAVGGGIVNAMAHFVPPARIPELLPEYQAYAQSILLEDVTLLPGAREILQAAGSRGLPCAIFTNKHGPSARRIAQHLGLDPYLRAVFGAEDTQWIKPQPEFARHAMEALGAEPATTCLVGDSPYDVAAAMGGGMSFAGVTTGTHAAEELERAGAKVVTRDLNELGALWGLL